EALEYLCPFVQRCFDRLRIGIVTVQRREPNPDIQAVGISKGRHSHHHFRGRQWKMRTVGSIIRTRRYQFDSIASENSEIAEILLPDGHIPRIIRIALGTIAELVTTQGIFWRAREIQTICQSHVASLHVQFTQESSDAKQYASRIISDHKDCRIPPPRFNAYTIAFGPGDLGGSGQFVGIRASETF